MSIALVFVGVTMAAVGVVHTAAPDLGHRDTLDRVGIGLSNVGGDIFDLFAESQLSGIEDYCRDVTDTEDDFEECVEDEQDLAEESFGSIEEGIGEVKDELRSQIRNNSIDRVIRGALMVAGGLILFRIHAPRTEVFADGLLPKRPAPTADLTPPSPSVSPPPPAPPAA